MNRALSRRTFVAGGLITPLAIWPRPARIATAQPPGSPVGMYRGNAARTGENPGPGPLDDPARLWSIHLGYDLQSSPAVVDGTVYIGSVSPGAPEGGALHAVDAATGIERWRLGSVPGDGIFSSPAVDNGIVVIGTYDGIILAADAATGQERWRAQAESAIWFQSPAIVDDVVYMTDIGAHLYALDAETGEERWSLVQGDGHERAFASPAVSDNVVYCVNSSRRPDAERYLHAFDAATGEQRWQFTPGAESGLVAIPVVVGDTVYVSSLDNKIFAVDTDTGDELARYQVDGMMQTELAIAGGLAYVGTGEGNLLAIDLENGDERWRASLEPGVIATTPPTVADGVVYVGDAGGKLYAVDAASGETYVAGQAHILWSSPAVVDGRIYLGGVDGALYAIGETRETRPPVHEPYVPAG